MGIELCCREMPREVDESLLESFSRSAGRPVLGLNASMACGETGHADEELDEARGVDDERTGESRANNFWAFATFSESSDISICIQNVKK